MCATPHILTLYLVRCYFSCIRWALCSSIRPTQHFNDISCCLNVFLHTAAAVTWLEICRPRSQPRRKYINFTDMIDIYTSAETFAARGVEYPTLVVLLYRVCVFMFMFMCVVCIVFYESVSLSISSDAPPRHRQRCANNNVDISENPTVRVCAQCNNINNTQSPIPYKIAPYIQNSSHRSEESGEETRRAKYNALSHLRPPSLLRILLC